MADSPGVVVSIVVQNKLSKPELLDAVARASGGRIVGAGTAGVFVDLGAGARADIEVPKFGEDVQLAVDVSADSPEPASSLLAALRALGFDVSVLGE